MAFALQAFKSGGEGLWRERNIEELHVFVHGFFLSREASKSFKRLEMIMPQSLFPRCDDLFGPFKEARNAEQDDHDVNSVFLWMLQLNSSKADLLLISLGITWHLTHCNKVTNRRVMWTYNPYIKDG